MAKLRHFESQSTFDSRLRLPGAGLYRFYICLLLTEDIFEKRYNFNQNRYLLLGRACALQLDPFAYNSSFKRSDFRERV